MSINKKLAKATLVILLIGSVLLALYGNNIGILGVGILLLIYSVWGFISAQGIWDNYKKYYKKIPKKNQNIWNEPKEIYFVINRYIFIPFGFAVGSLLVYMYWLLK